MQFRISNVVYGMSRKQLTTAELMNLINPLLMSIDEHQVDV